MKFEEDKIAAFWRKITKTDSCWLWNRRVTKAGYGVFWYKGKLIYAHRLAWTLVRGTIPSGMNVLHNCPTGDNPACVNPEHLFLGTQRDNIRDAFKKGRMINHGTPGEKHWKAKLSNEDIPAIRTMYGEGYTQIQLGKIFGVSNRQICNIVNREGWQCVS